MSFPDDVRHKEWDLVVIGGGINGAGVARDAVMRGLDVLLLEKGDFASGTSSRSTKLIHGGLRYLENFELGLVFESLRERSIQHRVAPHLVKPRKFLFPVYEHDHVPPWKLRIGLTIYDFLSLFRGFGRHRFLSSDDARRAFSVINPSGLRSAGLYHDCQMDDARLVLENILDADRRGATVRNYCEVNRVNSVPGRDLWYVTISDRRSGERFDVRTHKIVNATGPWSDLIAGEWRDSARSYLRPTKGAHLILPPIKTETAGFFPSVEDDRLIFIIPWQGKTLVGTTDTEFTGDPDKLSVTDQDRDYLLSNVNHYLDRPDFATEDILSEFAGLRPLYDPSGGEGPPGEVSRDHEILVERDSIFSVVGGKYTTYRAMAEETIDMVGADGRCRTHREHLPGGWKTDNQRETYKDALLLSGQLSIPQAEEILDMYGRNIIRLMEVAGQMPDAFDPVSGFRSTVNAQVYYSVIEEYALEPEDVVRRRTNLFTDEFDDLSRIRERMELARDWAGEE